MYKQFKSDMIAVTFHSYSVPIIYRWALFEIVEAYEISLFINFCNQITKTCTFLSTSCLSNIISHNWFDSLILDLKQIVKFEFSWIISNTIKTFNNFFFFFFFLPYFHLVTWVSQKFCNIFVICGPIQLLCGCLCWVCESDKPHWAVRCLARLILSLCYSWDFLWWLEAQLQNPVLGLPDLAWLSRFLQLEKKFFTHLVTGLWLSTPWFSHQHFGLLPRNYGSFQTCKA